jgi:cysteinyl-tRNA synthetase
MTIRLYNTIARSIKAFQPLAGGNGPVTFYTCGPTVYDYAHIGNFRSFLNADVLRRTLELHGHDVTHVMNITDVGHMTDDENADGGGEDKMEVASKRLLEAKKSGVLPEGSEVDAADPMAIADFYAGAFMEDARLLGLKVAFDAVEHPERMPRPSRYVAEMIALVEKLIGAGQAPGARDTPDGTWNVRRWPRHCLASTVRSICIPVVRTIFSPTMNAKSHRVAVRPAPRPFPGTGFTPDT